MRSGSALIDVQPAPSRSLPLATWRCGGHTFDLSSRPCLMGILNVTPDSFSDGGRFFSVETALLHASQMVAAGADIVDVGGESTRPGAEAVSVDEECSRIVPVIEALVNKHDVVVSIDTQKAEVARQAIAAGAQIVNDVSALTEDPGMLSLIADCEVGVVLMHKRGAPRTMQESPEYHDVVAEVSAYLTSRAEAVVEAGVDRGRIVLDPGIGFGKTTQHNLDLLGDQTVLPSLGYPLMIGLSRKQFLGEISGRSVSDRLVPSLAAAGTHVDAIAVGHGRERGGQVREVRPRPVAGVDDPRALGRQHLTEEHDSDEGEWPGEPEERVCR